MQCRTRLLALALVLGCACPAAAETFLLKNGARIYGVEEKHPRGEPSDEWMTVRTSYGRVSFKKADLKRKLTKGQERTTLYIEEACVTSVEGKAFKSDDGGKSWKPIPWSTGGKETVALEEFPPRVRIGEWVKTNAKSAIDLDVGWGLVRLDADSELHLAKFKGATLTLTRGRMGARLEELPKGKRFKVETPETTMGVEGTTFLVETQDATRIAVQSGSVLGKAGRIGAGQAQVVSPSGEVKVTPLVARDQAFFSLLEKAIALPRISWVPIPPGQHVMKAELNPSRIPSKRPLVHGTYDIPAFLLSRYEVTRGEFNRFTQWLAAHGDALLWPENRPPGITYHLGPEPPLQGWEAVPWILEDVCVSRVTADCARAYSRWVDARLPSEVEWEYASCGAQLGQDDLASSWDYLKYGWLAENSGREVMKFPGVPGEWAAIQARLGCRSHPVGRKRASPLGLFDILGNACEWVTGRLEAGPSIGASDRFPCYLKGGSFYTVNWCALGKPWGWIARRLAGSTAGIRLARDLPR